MPEVRRRRTATITAFFLLATGCGSGSGSGAAAVAAPSISRFAAIPTAVAAGDATALTADFTGGDGRVDPGIGPVTSGMPIATGPLAADTTFTLTVTGAAGVVASSQAVVLVAGAPGSITFITEGAGFAPVIVVDGAPQILWTFADGTTSASATPVASFGTAATRRNTLRVDPWSAVRRINVGYDGSDGGSSDIEHVPDQEVSAVVGLAVVAPTLEQWCSSSNPLTSLDFGGFTRLDTVEASRSPALVSVNLRDTPALARACFDQCGLLALDLSGSPALADLRSGVNAFPTVGFGSGTFPEAWHVCLRDNPQLTDRALFASTARFPAVSELWIWNLNQAGTLRIPSSHPSQHVSVVAHLNQYTSADLGGALRNASQEGVVDLSQNQLTSVRLDGCVQLTQLDLHQNALPQDQVDAVLRTLDELGRGRPQDAAVLAVDLRGGTNAAPSPAGKASATRLLAKGWAVYTN